MTPKIPVKIIQMKKRIKPRRDPIERLHIFHWKVHSLKLPQFILWLQFLHIQYPPYLGALVTWTERWNSWKKAAKSPRKGQFYYIYYICLPFCNSRKGLHEGFLSKLGADLDLVCLYKVAELCAFKSPPKTWLKPFRRDNLNIVDSFSADLEKRTC